MDVNQLTAALQKEVTPELVKTLSGMVWKAMGKCTHRNLNYIEKGPPGHRYMQYQCADCPENHVAEWHFNSSLGTKIPDMTLPKNYVPLIDEINAKGYSVMFDWSGDVIIIYGPDHWHYTDIPKGIAVCLAYLKVMEVTSE